MVRKSQKRLFSIPARDLDEILRASAADLEVLRGRRLFITGGTGFFGKWLLAAIRHANEILRLELSVAVLSRDPAAFIRRHPEAELELFNFVRGHVADFSLAGRREDFIIHAAADTTAFTSGADENERSSAIVAGTRRVLDLAKMNRARILNISSGAVYGAAAGQRDGAKEDAYETAQALTPYGEAKREAERLCANSGADFVTARAFAFLGPHLPLDAHFAAGNFLRDAVEGWPIEVRGDGTALRSYLYPTDLVICLLRILVRGERHRAYNVGSDEAVSTGELARLIANAVEPKPDVVIQSVQPQGPHNIYLPDIGRARAELQLGVTVPLREAITRTLDYLRPSASKS